MENLIDTLNTLIQLRKLLGSIISGYLITDSERSWYKGVLLTAGDLDITIMKLKKELKCHTVENVD